MLAIWYTSVTSAAVPLADKSCPLCLESHPSSTMSTPLDAPSDADLPRGFPTELVDRIQNCRLSSYMVWQSSLLKWYGPPICVEHVTARRGIHAISHFSPIAKQRVKVPDWILGLQNRGSPVADCFGFVLSIQAGGGDGCVTLPTWARRE